MVAKTGRSRELGEYVEYRESRAHWLKVFVPWLVISLGSAVGSFVADQESCFGAKCVSDARDRAGGFAFLFLLTFPIAAYFGWRRLARSPGIRVGTLGFENRTGILRFHRILWPDVIHMDGSFVQMSWVVDVIARTKSGPRCIRLRLSGLTAPPLEVEAAVREKVHEELRHRFAAVMERTHRPALDYPDQVLSGALIETDDSVFIEDPTQAVLLDSLAGLTPNSFVVVTHSNSMSEPRFIQVARNRDGSWQVEYQDGAIDEHYGATTDDLAAVHRAVVSWVMGWDWRGVLPWEHMTLTPVDRSA